MLCLPMIDNAVPEDHSSGLYFWARVFRATTWKELKKLAEEKPEFQKTIVTIAQLTEDEKIRQICEARKRYELDLNSAQRYGFEEGRRKNLLFLSRLSDILTSTGRMAELPKALKDETYLKKLMEEFGLNEE